MPTSRVDPSGLVSITVEINAFISSRHDPDGDGFIPMEPMDWTGHYFGTDRRLGGRPGTSRLHKFVSIDSCDIGSDVPFHTAARSDATRWGEWNGSNVVHTATKTGIPEDKTGVWKREPCTSLWGGKIAAKIPFITLAPSIYVDGEVEFAALPNDIVTVTFDLSVSRFPDFELYVKADGNSCKPTPVRTYYSSFTHPSYGVPYSKLMGMKQNINYAFTCAAPTPCRCKGTCK